MIIDEKYLRQIIRSSIIKEIGYGKVGRSGDVGRVADSSDSDESGEGAEGSHLNFKYVSIPNDAAANRAVAEMSDWSGKKEDNPSAKDKLKTYWNNIKDIFKQDPETSISKKEPWSAAFVSYVMQDPFFKSPAHITWKNKAEKNTEEVNKNPDAFAGKETYILLPLDQNVKLERGDNVWAPRAGGPNKSHSDVVISPTEAIGGNVSDTVGKKKIDHPFVIKKVKILGRAEKPEVASAQSAQAPAEPGESTT